MNQPQKTNIMELSKKEITIIQNLLKQEFMSMHHTHQEFHFINKLNLKFEKHLDLLFFHKKQF
tara:strand:- start:500 stop:688 length:189 start_codon:yes stop_codon:yes gene_type:complete